MPSVIDRAIDVTQSIDFEVQESFNWLWDEMDCHMSSTQAKKREFKLEGRSYYDIFHRNYFKLSNPNRSGAGIYSVIYKSNSSSLYLNEEKILSNQLDSLKNTFINILIAKAQDDSNEEVSVFIEKLLATYPKKSVLFWIQEIFNENCDNEKIVLGLLRSFQELEYNEVSLVAVTIAACCKNHKSYAVKSATFSLLGHWCNKQALVIITTFEEPNEMMLRIKYKKLKDIITAKCTT